MTKPALTMVSPPMRPDATHAAGMIQTAKLEALAAAARAARDMTAAARAYDEACGVLEQLKAGMLPGHVRTRSLARQVLAIPEE